MATVITGRRIRHIPDAEVRLTKRKGDAVRFARTALRRGCEMIVALPAATEP